ncbi:class I SAM-dependent methyltransferase [Salinibacter altiplanensis]|uniref:class I SAM-dependent methyltransferase n=1 Tax=Salinibacter altiplanensis TaxID=1803181 RepID=UPI000C9F7DD1|nr:class I SAM-dependent methyltransferase [Salinibacter altiplanensis]
MTARRTLSYSEVEAVYDRIGAWQDTQVFYEAPAFDLLVSRGHFETARSVMEVGCGTGRFAERLLSTHCPSAARYVGHDLSETMVRIARTRLASFETRATVRRTDGRLSFDAPDGRYDRVVATYLLDLLSRDDARTFLGEAHRLLRDDGRLCLAGLTRGRSLLPWCVSRLWNALHRSRPEWVGGCRPLRQRTLLDEARWAVQTHATVTGWGVPSEVLVATPA